MKKHIISISFLFSLILIGKLFISSTVEEGDNYHLLFENRYNVFALDLPTELEFAGEKVPLEIEDVKERFDRELHVNTYWQSQTLLLIKRAYRYFPVIRPILKKNGIPDDFKYLPLIESGFMDMVSPAGAEGPWQFLPATARNYGLEVNDEVDERYQITKASEAACKYLKEAHKRLGNWTLVAAAYNMGPNGVIGAVRKQKVNSYYDLDLNTQTSRYIFRLLAMKEVMENPKKYGFQYLKRHLYKPLQYVSIPVDSSITDMVSFAQNQGVNLKVLKEMNPWIKGNKLQNPNKKVYYIHLPKNRNMDDAKLVSESIDEDTLLVNFDIPSPTFLVDTWKSKKNVLLPESVLVKHREHVVASGEDIEDIAKFYKVSKANIIAWNGLKKTELKPGQKLKIYPKKIEKEKR